MEKVYIIEAKRTAIGSFLGALTKTHPADMGVALVKNILETTKVDGKDIDEVIVGNILPAGLGQGVGRQIVIKSGLPKELVGYSLNMVCGSGMKAVMNAYSNIAAGIHQLVLAGGVENMSAAPYLTPKTVRTGHKMGDITLKDHMVFDALTDVFEGYHMGVTAENIQEKHNISRVAQDEFAINSQMKAIAAIDAGKFKDEIVPLEIKVRRNTITFDTDEYPNRTTTLEKLATLRAVFKKGGTVTAGNSSGINDGGSMLLLANKEMVDKYNLNPMAEIIAVGQCGVDPATMGLGPVGAIKKTLKTANMKLKDMELLELNEAFSSQSLGVLKELSENHNVTESWIMERTNVNGGAIALGHPVGASGNRIIVTLLHEMIKRKNTYGLASLCIGGGMGTAVIVKNLRK
ncbi:MAG: acetyl-CoA C-acetyltransferase [Candidatus Izimaplasma sp.]|nr:acetyl-CoA C-acetyltransferase [Candidatus Izimaplasma bacterium]